MVLIQDNSCDKEHEFLKNYSRSIVQGYSYVLDNNRKFLEEIIKAQVTRDSSFVYKYKKLGLEYIEIVV
jgi:hypothetical protein